MVSGIVVPASTSGETWKVTVNKLPEELNSPSGTIPMKRTLPAILVAD